jgi:hypothetical protein
VTTYTLWLLITCTSTMGGCQVLNSPGPILRPMAIYSTQRACLESARDLDKAMGKSIGGVSFCVAGKPPQYP